MKIKNTFVCINFIICPTQPNPASTYSTFLLKKIANLKIHLLNQIYLLFHYAVKRFLFSIYTINTEEVDIQDRKAVHRNTRLNYVLKF